MMMYNEFVKRFDTINSLVNGGQKKVYKVTKDSEIFAFKVISNCNDRRVLQEIEILKNLNIKGVPKISDFGYLIEENGEQVLYILEEFICNDSLRKRVKNKDNLNLKEAFNILYSLLKIEVELEILGIIHRDIKPDNLLVNDDGEVFLIDFGVAKVLGNVSLTVASNSSAPHTPGYAPSEQIMNDRLLINSKTDLYQIGVTLYELISGKNPFLELVSNIDEVHNRTLNFTPQPLVIEGDELGQFSSLISMLMAKLQSQRPDNAVKALEYLDAIKGSLKWEGQ